jgi:hypothetical protein
MTEELGTECANGTEDFLWEVHKYTNEYIRFADTKAAFIAGVSTALIGSLVASSLFNSCLRTTPWSWSKLQWTAAVGLSLLAISVGCSIAVIRPRLWNKVSVGYIFWGSIAGHVTAPNFTRAVQKLNQTERSCAISDHLFVLASIAKRKYGYVDRGLYFGIGGGTLTAIVLFMRHALN